MYAVELCNVCYLPKVALKVGLQGNTCGMTHMCHAICVILNLFYYDFIDV